MTLEVKDARDGPARRPSVRIVLASSHTMLREGIRRLLETEADLTVVAEAGDLDETVRVALDLQPDVLVLDVTRDAAATTGMLNRVTRVLAPQRCVLLTDDVKEIHASLERRGVRGVVAPTASIRELVAAIRAVHRGDSYVSAVPSSMTIARPSSQAQDVLTGRELEILRLVAEGLSNGEVSERLSIAPRTVRFHLGHVFAKLGARSRTEAVHLARQRGWFG